MHAWMCTGVNGKHSVNHYTYFTVEKTAQSNHFFLYLCTKVAYQTIDVHKQYIKCKLHLNCKETQVQRVHTYLSSIPHTDSYLH